MAYLGEYGGGGGGASQRSHSGPAAHRPTARGAYGNSHTQQQYDVGQPYNDYHDNYGYESQAETYGDNKEQHYRDQYGSNPGRGAGQMPSYARGRGPGRGGSSSPIPQPGTTDSRRGGQYPSCNGVPGPGREITLQGGTLGERGRGRGRGWPEQYPLGDYNGRRPRPLQPDAAYDDGYGQDQRLAGQMSGMNLNTQRSRGHGDGRLSYETSYGQDDYGRPVNVEGRGHLVYDGFHQGIPARQAGAGNHADYDDHYGASSHNPMRNAFGPSGRSMTMPMNDPGPLTNMPPPRHAEMALDNVPPRPSTAGGHRPPPQRIYPPSKQGVSHGQYGGVSHYDGAYGNSVGQLGAGPNSASDDVHSYYDSSSVSSSKQHQNTFSTPSESSSFPNFDSSSADSGPRTHEKPFRPATEQAQPGAHGTPRLHHAKSEANFHEPQTAVFEMAGDIPSVPPVPQAKPYRPDVKLGYGEATVGYDQLPPRGPSAPPGPVQSSRRHDLEDVSAIGRHNTVPSVAANLDSFPSHPLPVRPGLMPNSMVNLNDRPPPVRNYGVAMQQQQQQQQQYQQLPRAQQTTYLPPEVEQTEEPVTTQQLERLRMATKVNVNDHGSALKLAKKLLEAADHLAPKLPDPKQRSRARERYLMDAHKVLKKLANAQNPEAMYTLADSLGKGVFGNEPDNKEAFTLYQSAAKLGHAQAAYRTAVCCEIGHEDGGGTRKDPLKAMQWYKRAATLGDTPAMYKVGMILLKGLLGQGRNPREAVGWLKRAAERADKENPHALHELGLLYESAQPNDAIIRDDRYALDLFQQAAALGYKFSQFRLGLAYEHGQLGVERDHRQSIYWYSQAAQQEEHQSELALSGWYLTGSPDVLNQSDTEAYLWARKAAVAGLAKAEYAMGYFTEVGIGVTANLEDAKRWYWRAAAQDFPKARERLEDLKRVGKSGPARPRERISRSRIERQQQDGECTIM